MKRMTNKEILVALISNTPLSRARRVFSSEMGRIEQEEAQPLTPTPVERRRMEFEAVHKIALELGVELD